MSASSPSEAGLLKSSMASASSLMALQLLSRLFTFALNQALFRLASPSAFGAAAIQFELILSTILFLSREGVRNAVLRVSKNPTADSTIKRMNLSFLPILVGMPLSMCTCFLYIHYAGQEIHQQPHFRPAIMLYALSAVIELLSEPLYNVVMVELKTSVRVRAEGLGITAKSVITFAVLLYDSRSRVKGDLALLAFAFGQLVYGLVMLMVYVVYLGKGHLYPKRPSSSGESLFNYVDQETLYLSFTMTLQSLVKHFLTEGDKLILSWYSPLHDQGGYAIAVNYGSLIARIIFQPVEESLRVFFSRVLGGNTEKKKTEERQASLIQSVNALRSLLSVQVSLSIILTVFGSAYISILLPLLLPNQYLSTSAPRVLAAWIWYIPFLAINGGLEAFLSSVATPQDLNEQSRWMIGFSMIYIVSAILLYREGFGDSSLVYANIINLSVRIIYALRFITNFFKTSARSKLFDWKDSLPPWQLLAASIVSLLTINISDSWFKISIIITTHPGRLLILNPSILIHVSIGALLGLFCLSTWWMSSGRYLKVNTNRQKED